MITQAIDTAKSLQRVKNYLERFEQGKGYYKECIHSFIDKNGDEIPLLVADLKSAAAASNDRFNEYRRKGCCPVSLATR